NKNMIWVQRYDKTDFPFELYINPKIIWRSKLLRKGGEGCLSIPEQRNDVQRNYSIRLQYWTKEGEIKEELIEGFTAVIFQHEVDHRSEEHTSELQSRENLVCRLLLE